VIPALSGVRNAAVQAAVLLVIVVYLFLGSLRRFQRMFGWLTDLYGWLLGWLLRWRWIAVPAFVAVVAASFWTLGRLGAEFLPAVDDGRVMVKVKLPTGASLLETQAVIDRLEQVVLGDEMVDSVFALVGGKVWGLYTYEIRVCVAGPDQARISSSFGPGQGGGIGSVRIESGGYGSIVDPRRRGHPLPGRPGVLQPPGDDSRGAIDEPDGCREPGAEPR
jgi:hypothetical protein